MKIITFIIIALSLLGCSSVQKSANGLNTLGYVFEQQTANGKNWLKVTFSFPGNANGKTVIDLPNEWAGNNYAKDIANFAVVTKDVQINPGEQPHKRLLIHKPNEKLTVTYEIVQTVDKLGKTYRNMVTPEYFHFVGGGGLVVPAWGDDVKVDVNMRWKNFPRGTAIANSFGALSKDQNFIAQLGEMQQAVYVGGDYRVQKIIINGKPLFVALRGQWSFSDADYGKLIKDVITYQRNFFRDNDFDYFLITMTPNGEPCCSTGGTGLTNSFATFVPNDHRLEVNAKFLLSHELFHTWNGRKINRQEPEQLIYWFSEGFTDYYSRLLLLRANQMTLKEFVADYNEVLYEYFVSPMINEPNSRILKDFWNNYDIEKLPYRRGNILARRWNTLIKNYSGNKHSMDNVLLDLFREAQSKGTVVSPDNIDRLTKTYNSKGLAADLEKYINKGATIVPGENDLGPCVKRKKTKLGKFAHGYNSRETYEKNVIAGLKKDSNAYKAGLRDGYELLGRNIVFPPVSNSRVHIDDGKTQRWIEFLPTVGKKYDVYFYELDEKMFDQDPKKCLAWFE